MVYAGSISISSLRAAVFVSDLKLPLAGMSALFEFVKLPNLVFVSLTRAPLSLECVLRTLPWRSAHGFSIPRVFIYLRSACDISRVGRYRVFIYVYMRRCYL